MTLFEYRALLARLYGFHLPLESGLCAAPAEARAIVDLRARARAPALRADLRTVGMSEGEIDALPICKHLPPVRSSAELLGRLYVIEGSALGGRVMAGKLDRLLGPNGTRGRQFLSGRVAPDPLPWPTFCRLLETQSAPSDVDAMIQSAETTFQAMALWLVEGEAHG